MKLSTLYQRAKNGKVNEWEVEIEGNRYRTISGYLGGIKTFSDWTICDSKSYCTAEEQALKEATAMHRKKMELGSFENLLDVDEETFYEPMLAKKWEDRKDKVEYPLASQPKLDGMRCIVKRNGMWSRKGKPIISAPHIFEALKPLFDENPDLIFDGELYCDKLSNDFNTIMSLVKKTKPSAGDIEESAGIIEYHVYDLPSVKSRFFQRNSVIQSELVLPKCCKKVETIFLYNEDEVNKQLEIYLEQGYEGQILRLDTPYENKRSNGLLKHKLFMDEEFIILDVMEGIGNMSGKVGKMLFKTKFGNNFTAPVNCTWEESEEIWKNKEQFVGKKATVKFFGYTPDGSVRFPKVKEINRLD